MHHKLADTLTYFKNKASVFKQPNELRAVALKEHQYNLCVTRNTNRLVKTKSPRTPHLVN